MRVSKKAVESAKQAVDAARASIDFVKSCGNPSAEELAALTDDLVSARSALLSLQGC